MFIISILINMNNIIKREYFNNKPKEVLIVTKELRHVRISSHLAWILLIVLILVKLIIMAIFLNY